MNLLISTSTFDFFQMSFSYVGSESSMLPCHLEQWDRDGIPRHSERMERLSVSHLTPISPISLYFIRRQTLLTLLIEAERL